MKPGDAPQVREYTQPYGQQVMHVRQTTEIVEVRPRCQSRQPVWQGGMYVAGDQQCDLPEGHGANHEGGQTVTFRWGSATPEAMNDMTEIGGDSPCTIPGCHEVARYITGAGYTLCLHHADDYNRRVELAAK